MKKNDFSELYEPVATVVSDKVVPNNQPTITNVPYKLAIIGEAPGSDEIDQCKPFVGYSGQILERFLSRFGILRDGAFIGNICQHQPLGNKIATFNWDGPQISTGIHKLSEDLKRQPYNCVLLLGGSALHAFKNPHIVPKKRKSKDGLAFDFPDKIGDWRGSFFMSHPQAPLGNVKCIASYHPAACLRNYEWVPYLMMDIKRALDEATTPELHTPTRELKVNLSFDETCAELDKITSQCEISDGTDIEGYWNNWKCISFAPSPSYSFIVPLVNMRGESYWTLDEETTLWEKMCNVLSNPKITKVWQNGLYDRFVLQYGYGIVVRGPSHDIMLKHWELYCELEKALGVQASIYTAEPFYKAEIKSDDRETFWKYCCKDSTLTKEIDLTLDRYLQPDSRRHYNFNLTLLNALLYMELRGIRYDKKEAQQRKKEIDTSIYTLQHRLDRLANMGVRSSDRVVLIGLIRDTMCYKKDQSKVKVGYEEEYGIQMRVLHGDGKLSEAEVGRLSTALGLELNIKGAALKKYLYETLALPEQRDPKTKAVTTDYEALIKLKRIVEKKDGQDAIAYKVLELVIEIGELRTRSQMLEMKTDPDGRIRSSYNEVGSETGRVTSLTSPTGSGYNLQTIPDENELKKETSPLRNGMRDLLLADEGCYLAKCDLKGADGWTVGANLASLGDSTMLDDLRFGLKPASVLCYASRYGPQSIIGKTREQLSQLCQEVKKSDWDYFAYKQCIWGFCYLMGVRKAVDHVFNVSEGTVLVKESDMQMAKDMLFRRYNIQLWHRAMEQRLFKQPYPPKLTSPSGHTRMFFNRKQEIVGQALAHEPQSVTTYATNQAVYRCWTDIENRVANKNSVDGTTTRCRLRIEPMHQVHDEFLCQFKIEDTTWAIDKIKQWFNNEINIAGIKVVIPFEGNYGINWAMDKESKKGSIQ